MPRRPPIRARIETLHRRTLLLLEAAARTLDDAGFDFHEQQFRLQASNVMLTYPKTLREATRQKRAVSRIVAGFLETTGVGKDALGAMIDSLASRHGYWNPAPRPPRVRRASGP